MNTKSYYIQYLIFSSVSLPMHIDLNRFFFLFFLCLPLICGPIVHSTQSPFFATLCRTSHTPVMNICLPGFMLGPFLFFNTTLQLLPRTVSCHTQARRKRFSLLHSFGSLLLGRSLILWFSTSSCTPIYYHHHYHSSERIF